MGMPLDLVLVRHGQSEGNVALHLSKRGDDRHMNNPAFRARHSSWWRLTDLGVQQAEMAGEWIRQNLPREPEPEPMELSREALLRWAKRELERIQRGERRLSENGPRFDRYYTSAYTRAMETAAYLRLPEARWYIEPRLRERERGKEDLLSSDERALLADSERERENAPLYWRPLNGESIADTCTRVRDLLETLHRETDGGRVIVVCHGEVMESFRIVLERMTHHEYMDWTRSGDPLQRIHNGQVFHYTRRDPSSGQISPYLNWFRSVCTSDLSLCDPSWKTIQRPVFDNQALLEMAQRTPRLIHS